MSQHIIRQQKVEISSGNAKKSQELFTAISSLFNNRVRDVTDRLFDKYGGDDVLLKLDTLELDMGSMSFPFSEEEFVKGYSEKLEELLVNVIRKQREVLQAQEGDQVNTRLSLVDLLEQYLLTGTIAWWVNTEELKNPIRVFNTVYEKNISVLQSMINRMLPETLVRKRLVYSFEEETIRRVIRFIQPTEEKFISQYHSEVVQLHRESNFVKAENAAFKRDLWLFILDFLAEHSGSRFNRKMFVKATLRSIAGKFNMSFEQVLFYFAEAVKAIPADYRKTENLVGLVEEISIEFETERSGTRGKLMEETPAANKEHLTAEEYPLFFFLVHGFLPFSSFVSGESAISADFVNEMRRNESYTRVFFARHGRSTQMIKRLVSHFDETALQAAVRVVEPAGAETIISYADYTGRFQTKANLVKAEDKVFRQSLWELVFSYLFSERSSVFNAKMFLVSNIRALARHYNMDYTRLLAILVQGVGQQISAVSDQSGLFYLLTEILAEDKELKKMQEQDKQQMEEKSIEELAEPAMEIRATEQSLIRKIMDQTGTQTDEAKRTFVLNLFLHLLEYGELPWWVGEEKLSFMEIITKLRPVYEEQLRKAFLYAAKKRKVGLHFLEQYASLFNAELRFLFKDTILAEKFSLVVKELASSGLLNGVQDMVFAKSILAALYESSNETPDPAVFFTALFTQIEGLHGKGTVEKISMGSSRLHILNTDDQLKKAYGKAAQDYQYLSLSTLPVHSDQDFMYLVQRSVNPSGNLSIDELADLLRDWIAEYAVYGKLPSNATKFSSLSENEWVARAMEFLFRQHRDTLTELLVRLRNRPGEQSALLNALNSTSGMLEVCYFLESNMQENLLRNSLSSFTSNTVDAESWKQLIGQLKHAAFDEGQKTLWTSLFKLRETRAIVPLYIADGDLEVLFENFGQPRLLKSYRIFHEALVSAAAEHFEREQFKKWITEFFLTILAGQVRYEDAVSAMARQFATFLLLKTQTPDQKIFDKLKKIKDVNAGTLSGEAKTLISDLHSSYSRAIKNEKSTNALEKEIAASEKKMHALLSKEEKRAIDNELKEILEARENGKKKNTLAFGEQVYIRNAGMVLLHPFVSTLFARAGLTTDGAFDSEENQAKAAMLLQYAVTGTEDDPEHELILNKIFVGMQPEEVMSGTVVLNEEDRELTKGMIGAIMQQWDKMKNTSPEGFRNSFLIREGYVFQTDEAWVLRVEQRAYDILLQTLPWSFGMIKFSWMTKPLIVEWT